ncbi:MAG: TonB-dependent receptor, partial [Rikenellaceae bacterium]
HQGTKVSLGVSNYGGSSVRASNYSKLSDKVGISLGGYFDRTSGYFTNIFTGNKVDDGKSAGGNFKLDYRISNRWLMKLSSAFDYTDQGAFAYGMYHKDTKVIDPVDYNDEGSYKRKMSNNNLRFEYKTDKVLISSNTGYQHLNDDMRMDQDFTNLSIFTINQRQRQNSFSQEFAARSVTKKNYQWSFGAFGFYNDMRTNGDVVFKEDGIKTILQPVFDNMMPPQVPVKIKINDKEIPNPGTYETPSYGLALFHQSTVNNLFTDGLSLTVGLRVDYEKQWLDYNTSMAMNTTITSPMMPRPIPYNIAKTLTGDLNQDFVQVLPKVSLKYECTDNIMTYATVSKGYKAGGYNIQMFSEVIQDSLKKSRPAMPGMPSQKPIEGNTLSETVSFKPEITWNYEIGMRGEFLDGKLRTELALFYMNIRDLQLTQFVTGGSGRILSNAGKGRSLGAELSVSAAITKELTLEANYGYTHATFTNYNDGKNDYKGKFIPYTPRNTFSVGGTYSIFTNCNFIQQVSLTASYNGCGNIYWTEKNDIKQPFYGLLNAKLSLRHGGTRLEVWGRNLTCEKYGAFYFESFGKSFVQRGKPLTFGANLIFTI